MAEQNTEKHRVFVKRNSSNSLSKSETHKAKLTQKSKVRRSASDFGLLESGVDYLDECDISASLEIDKREREKNELKAKVEELEGFKTKYEAQVQENERLQAKLDQMVLCQSDASQKLYQSTENVDRLRVENKKKVDQIEKQQRDIRYMEDRVRNLEIRASDVEKAELILETTKQNLEQTQIQVRDRDHQIRRLTSDNDKLEKQLNTANDKIANLEEKGRDLNYQIRHELMRNENIQKNLETIPKLKEKINENEEEIERLKSELEEKSALLMAARKAVREYKDQCRGIEHKVAEAEQMQEDLEIAQCEVHTLKHLLHGKDSLVIQKSKALDVAKDVIETMQLSTEPEQINKIVLLLERIGATSQTSFSSSGSVGDSTNIDIETHTRGTSSFQTRNRNASIQQRGIDVNRNPYPSNDNEAYHQSKRPLSSGGFLDKIFYERTSSSEDLRAKTAVVRPTIKKSQSWRDTSHNKGQITLYQKVDSKREHSTSSHRGSSAHSKFQPPKEFAINVKEGNGVPQHRGSQSHRSPSGLSERTRSRSDQSLSEHSVSSSSDMTDSDEITSSEILEILSKLSTKEREKILLNYINQGDRILLSIPQKPPKYGKKIVPKPKIFTGIVKYRGTLDKGRYDPRLYVGVRLDEPMGDTDGLYKGKRYMYAPADQGKFFKLIDVTSVLDVQDGKYKLITTHLRKHLIEQSKASKS